MRDFKKILFCFILTCSSLTISIAAIEILFRIWRPPQLRLGGMTILLVRNKTIENNFYFNSDKIQNHITIKKNSLGFRGPEPPIDFSRHLTMLAIGGSTTETIFITEGKTWTDYLQTHLVSKFPNLWINNAGIDGHSTYGHIQSMKQYIGQLKSKYVLFLVGINDMGIEQGRNQDNQQIMDSEPNQQNNLWQMLKNQSMILVYFQFLGSKKGGHDFAVNSDWIINYSVLGTNTEYTPITNEDMTKTQILLSAYKKRLRTLITLTQSFSIKPILITQPAVYGSEIDDVTGINLGEIPVSDFTEEGITRSGSDKWMLLQKYNDVTKEIAHELEIPVIDLANEMPKSTRYYYDYTHFTEKGAEKVGEILAQYLVGILKE